MSEVKSVWDRDMSLDMLAKLAKRAVDAAAEYDGDNIVIKNQTAMVALRAIDLANKMCGFASPSDETDTEYKKLEDFI